MTILSWMLPIFLFLVLASDASQFPRKQIDEIVKQRAKLDQKKVELAGTLVLGAESATIKDDSICPELVSCALAVEFSYCKITGDIDNGKDCLTALNGRFPAAYRGNEITPSYSVRVIIRGVLTTIPRDISYDKSVPARLRMGFGHLRSLPGKIVVSDLSFW